MYCFGRVKKSLTGFHDTKISKSWFFRIYMSKYSMCHKYHHSGCQEPTFQTEEARLAVTEVVEVVVPRRPPGPQTLKRPLSKVGETPQTPNNTYTFLLCISNLNLTQINSVAVVVAVVFTATEMGGVGLVPKLGGAQRVERTE